jgi:hypothetical protein
MARILNEEFFVKVSNGIFVHRLEGYPSAFSNIRIVYCWEEIFRVL